MAKSMEEIAECVAEGKALEVKQLVERAIQQGQDAQALLHEGLLTGIGIIGETFKKGETFIPEVLVAVRAMKEGMAVLRPLLVGSGLKKAGTVVLGTVSGDLHDIGKNIVGMMLEAAEFEVVDLGIDVPAERFIEMAREKQADIIGVSALLTTTMPRMQDVVSALASSDLKGKTKILIGGAPITYAYAEEIGADGYAPDAASAMDKARQLCGIS
jgi:5-methyltetrahydrofolate--homocysteine methyltransferase